MALSKVLSEVTKQVNVVAMVRLRGMAGLTACPFLGCPGTGEFKARIGFFGGSHVGPLDFSSGVQNLTRN